MATTTAPKTLADYAAIAVAPLLIFLMINSLANYLMLVLYHGGYPERVSWTLFMYTMGVVSVARIAIQRDRSYAMGYLCVLGAVTFLAMMRFVGSPVFSIFMLVLIAFLADRIVHDCTLIDDSVDASGQGLMDSGGHFVRKQLDANHPSRDTASTATDEEPITKAQTPQAKRGDHQPGRTVMYLALAALPLFGLGQFFLRSDPGTSSRAMWLLAVYLFASFSLLVTTSFLGLRRYLRQRGVDMPNNVSVGWITGGLAIISMILLVSYLAPMPGKVLASFELPEFTSSPDDFSASEYGHGDEAAGKKKEGAAVTAKDKNAEGKEIQGNASQKDAPPGAAAKGDNKKGSPGKQDGGKKPSPGDPSAGDPSGEDKGSENKQREKSESQGEKGKQEKQDASNEQSSEQTSEQNKSDNKSKPEKPNSDDAEKSQNEGTENQPKPQSEKSDAEKSPAEKSDAEKSSSEQADTPPSESAANEPPPPPEPSPANPTASLSKMLSMIGSLLKFLIALGLACVVGVFVYRNREAILEWFNGLWARQLGGTDDTELDLPKQVTEVPSRSFSSFRNPIGTEKDPRQIVIVTFQAFEAWTREQGSRRRPDETPSEFLKRIAGTVPQLSTSAVRVVDAYNRIVYGGEMATKADISAADHIWKQMKGATGVTAH